MQRLKLQGMGMRERPQGESEKEGAPPTRAEPKIRNVQFERLCVAANMLLYGLGDCVWSQAGWCGE